MLHRGRAIVFRQTGTALAYRTQTSQPGLDAALSSFALKTFPQGDSNSSRHCFAGQSDKLRASWWVSSFLILRLIEAPSLVE